MDTRARVLYRGLRRRARNRTALSAAHGSPALPAVVYFPGSDAIGAGPSDKVDERLSFALFISHLLKSGRAVLYPVYKGTHERSGGKQDYYEALHASGDPTQEYADYHVTLVRDVRRSLDYLTSRSEIDGRRLAFSGFSWGGFVAPIVLAVEQRFAAAIIVLGGFDPEIRPRPEVDPVNYAPRVRLPSLMLNGRYDLVVPLDSAARPMFLLLGTPPDNKMLRIYDSDHSVPRSDLIRESLAWLDRSSGAGRAGQGSAQGLIRTPTK